MESNKNNEIIKLYKQDAWINTEIDSNNLTEKDSKLRECVVRGFNKRLEYLLSHEHSITARIKSLMQEKENSLISFVNAITKAFLKFKQTIDFWVSNSQEKYNNELPIISEKLQKLVQTIYWGYYNFHNENIYEVNLSNCFKDVLDTFTMTLPLILKNISDEAINKLIEIEDSNTNLMDLQKSQESKAPFSKLCKIVTKDNDLDSSDEEAKDKDIEENERIRLKHKVKRLTKEIKYLNTEIKTLNINKRKYFLPPLEDQRSVASSQEIEDWNLNNESVVGSTAAPMLTKGKDWESDKESDIITLKKINSDLIDIIIGMKIECSTSISILESKKFKRIIKQGNQLLGDYFSLRKKVEPNEWIA